MNVTIRDEIFIRATPEEVWDYTQDWTRRHEWDAAVRSAEVLGAAPRVVRMRGAASFAATVTYKLDDRPRRTSLAMTEVSSPVVAGGGGSWEYAAENGGTRFSQSNTITLRDGLLARAAAPLLSWMFRRSTRKALRTAKRILEAGAADAGARRR